MAGGRGGGLDLGLHARSGAVGLTLPVEERDLTDRSADGGILGRGGKRVAPSERGAERRDSVSIDVGQGAGERNRRTPIFQLQRGIDMIRLPGAVAEAAVIENHGRDARLRETLGESSQTIAPSSGQAVGHHDQRGSAIGAGVARWVKPRGADVRSRREGRFFAPHAY